MPSAKHNSTMDKATGLIFSLFNITLSQDVPFHQLQYVQCTYHGLTSVLLCVPVIFADNARCRFAIARYGFHLTFQCVINYWGVRLDAKLFYGMPGTILSFNVVHVDSVVIIVLLKKETNK